MKALYIGILTNGSTSRMRADTLQKINGSANWERIDTDIGFQGADRIWKTTAFRFRAGPLVRRLNREIIKKTKGRAYDLVWVDKGVYLWPETIDYLRRGAARLVHFTPDTAFYANRSRHFFSSASKYDLLVTTKSFEVRDYRKLVEPDHVLLVTQAYDSGLHRPVGISAERKPAAVFIGLCEPDRENCVDALLDAGVPVRIGGRGWEKFISRHAGNANLQFLGQELFGDQYVREYASATVGLGLLSKRFPELHTTRTFEIPACGAVLATEWNAETSRFFREDDVLFFEDYEKLAIDLKKLLNQPEKMEEVSRKGYQRVTTGGYDYATVLSGILSHLGNYH